MAIKIDIPGIGEVIVDGAAQESTMQEILKAVKKTDKVAKDTEKALAKSQAELIKQANTLDEAFDQLKDTVDDLDTAIDDVELQIANFSLTLGRSVSTVNKNLIGFGADLSSTAKSVATSWAKGYDEIARNPIKAGAESVSTALDILGEATKRSAKIIGATVSIIGGLSERWLGPGATRIIDKTAEKFGVASEALVDFGVETAQAANTIMSEEYQKRARAFADITRSGASFAGGMTEMAAIANQGGLGLADFSQIVDASRQSIYNMGMSASDGAVLLSKGLRGLAADGGRLRGQLLNLGYDYEQQGEILAQYAAQQAMSGRLQGMTDSQLAQGTAEYAKNLKVLSDLTGKDAKQLMDKARDETMRSAVLSQLQGDQVTAFQQAIAQLGELDQDFARALTQKIAGGAVAIPQIAANQQALAVVDSVAELVRSGNGNIQEETQRIIAENAAQYKAQRDQFGRATDTAAAYGVQSVQDIARIGNAFEKYLLPKDAAKRSKDLADAQSTTTDAVTQGFAAVTEQTRLFKVQMEQLTGKYLPEYATLLKETLELTSKMLVATGRFISSGFKDYAAFGELLGEKSGSTEKPASAPTGTSITDTPGGKKASQDFISGGMMIKDADGNYTDTYLKHARALNKKMGVPGYAKGGISSGPLSGYTQVLHGTEAVVPLPDNKSIPVSLDSGTLTAAVERNNGLLKDILSAMQTNNTLTSGILQQSY